MPAPLLRIATSAGQSTALAISQKTATDLQILKSVDPASFILGADGILYPVDNRVVFNKTYANYRVNLATGQLIADNAYTTLAADFANTYPYITYISTVLLLNAAFIQDGSTQVLGLWSNDPTTGSFISTAPNGPTSGMRLYVSVLNADVSKVVVKPAVAANSARPLLPALSGAITPIMAETLGIRQITSNQTINLVPPSANSSALTVGNTAEYILVGDVTATIIPGTGSKLYLGDGKTLVSDTASTTVSNAGGAYTRFSLYKLSTTVWLLQVRLSTAGAATTMTTALFTAVKGGTFTDSVLSPAPTGSAQGMSFYDVVNNGDGTVSSYFYFCTSPKGDGASLLWFRTPNFPS